jgi:signal transduction histidine kinase
LQSAKEELARANADLEKIVEQRTAQLRDTVSELEAFSYSLSHDMRAPLRAIVGYSQLALEEGSDQIGPTSVGFLQRVIASAERMDRMIQDVLIFARLSRQEISLQTIDVDKLARDIIHERPEFQAPKARVAIEGALLPVIGHEASLTQCLTNLLSNAVKFVAPGVHPNVRLRSEAIADGNGSNGSVRLWVEDNGIGIAPANRTRLFEIFQRINGEGTYEGTGIGLAIVRKATERMNGESGVESELGRGSQFWIELPGAPR